MQSTLLFSLWQCMNSFWPVFCLRTWFAMGFWRGLISPGGSGGERAQKVELHIRVLMKFAYQEEKKSQPESLVLLWKKLTSRSRQHATQREMFVDWDSLIQTVCFLYPSKSIFNTWSHQILNTETDIVSLSTLQRHEFECERSMHYQSMGRSRVHCPRECL